MKFHLPLISMIGLAGMLSVQAGELVYEPVNPAFGGSPLNGDWLLTSAQLQDHTEEPVDDIDVSERTALDRFNDMLERLVLSQISTAMINQFTEVVGDETLLAAGTHTIGNFQVQVVNTTDFQRITTTDLTTGQTTEFLIDLSY